MQEQEKPLVPLREIPQLLQQWSQELGFQQLGITDIDLSEHADYLHQWLANGHHGNMEYMQRHAQLRINPELLVPNTIRVIVARMNYRHENKQEMWTNLEDKNLGYVSRYATGRDYHKVVRRKLAKLAVRLREIRPEAEVRAFCDSAPVLEKALAQKAGLGWIGKNTLLLNPDSGSWFFLGEIFTSLPLAVSTPFNSAHCGSCDSCLKICPTNAFKGPGELDARLCISYLTIENKGDIPLELRGLIGNRVFGCDDCQLACPWPRRAEPASEPDFSPRSQFQAQELLHLFSWTKEEFLHKTAGTAIRRINFQQWLRNIAVALGNAPSSANIQTALQEKAAQDNVSEMVKGHIKWALERQELALKAAT